MRADESGHEKPRLVIVDASVALTGGFRAAANTAEALAGIMDVVLVLPHRARLKEADLRPFREVVRVPMVQVRRSLKDLILYLPFLLIASLKLRRMLAPAGSFLVLNDFYLMHGACLRLLGYRGFIGTWVRRNPNDLPGAISRVFVRQILRSSDRIFVVAKHLMKSLPERPDIGLLYDPIGIDPDQERLSQDVTERQEQRIVYVSNYIRGKGQEFAIPAFASIAAGHPAAELHFWGGDMGLQKNALFRRELEEMARSSGFGDRIKFHGFAEDPHAVLASAAVALNLSESEALSFACIEASLAGAAVIATRCGGPEEIIIDGETGFLVEKGDVAGIADRMSRLLGDPAAARRMGTAGTQFVGTTFSDARFRGAFLDTLGIAQPKPQRR